MPDGDEREDSKVICDASDFAPEAWEGAAAERDVKVAQTPLVEGAVPATPELHDGVVVAHAADHVLWRIDAVEQSPQAEEAPRDQQLQPDVFQVEEAQHAELCRGIVRPVWFCVEDGYHVHVVDHDLHGQKHNDETNGIHSRALRRDAVRSIAGLRDIVVECKNWPSKIEGRIHRVSKIVAETEVMGLGGNRNAVAL